MEKDKEWDELLTLAAKLILNPNDEIVRKDPLFLEKKNTVLNLLETLAKPKIREEGGYRYAFPLLKEQKEIKGYIQQINEVRDF